MRDRAEGRLPGARPGTTWVAAALAALFLAAGSPQGVVRPALAQKRAELRGIASLKRKMARHLRDTCLRNARVGVRAFSLAQRRVLYDHRGNRLFIPASNAKVLTTAAAFYFLKPDYTFKTDVYYTGRLSAGRLSGDLYLKGFGDPSLVSEELWLLVRALKRQGLREVRGDLVVDDAYFDGERFVPGTGSEEGLRPFQAPHGAASLNFNTLGLYVKPGPAAGKPPRATVEPDSPYVQLVNKAKTVGHRRKARLRVRRSAQPDGDRIILEGGIRA
ncbi:MAG: D-alanyl-D-alanine carboxypeptidase/D-alanyl-D-alanine-endopeptidase, partial [Nitrospinota bacterium]